MLASPVKILSILSLILLLPAAARPWSDDVIYFVMTDRFNDADPASHLPTGCDPELHDPAQKDINRYLGGDLRGLEKAIQSGYFNDLGVTALWLTPVVKNVWRSGYDLGGWKSGYHGCWAQDWLDIDPHLTSRASRGPANMSCSFPTPCKPRAASCARCSPSARARTRKSRRAPCSAPCGCRSRPPVW